MEIILLNYIQVNIKLLFHQSYEIFFECFQGTNLRFTVIRTVYTTEGTVKFYLYVKCE